MSTAASRNGDDLRARAWLAVLLALGPWTAHIMIAWAFPAALCGGAGNWPLHVGTLLAIAATVVGALLAHRLGGVSDDRAGPGSSYAFIGRLALWTGALLVLALVISWAFVLTIGPCR
jgi:hypothetical protein